MNQRFLELDVWRGLAVIGMVIFHFIFFLDYLKIQPFFYNQGGWLLLARFVQWSFLLLVGIGLQLSYQRTLLAGKGKAIFLLKNLRRSLVILFCALLVTASTGIVVPQEYIRFGILHLIATSSLLLAFIVDLPVLALVFSAFFYFGSFWVSTMMITTPWLIPFGFSMPGFRSLDYFSIFPWMGIPALGIFLGSLLFRHAQRTYRDMSQIISSQPMKALAAIGMYSLFIYMLHIPLLFFVISFLFGK